MPADTILALVQEQEFFRGLPLELCAQVAACGQEVQYPSGHYLFFEGEQSDALYLVVDGQVELEMMAGNLGLMRIDLARAGHIVGWTCLVAPYRYTLNARTAAPARLVRFDAPALRALCSQSPALGYELLRRLVIAATGRLGAARRQLLEQSA